MIRTFLDACLLIKAFQGHGGTKVIELMEDETREFVASSLLKLELLPQPAYHQRPQEVAFYEAYFARVSAWAELSEALVSAALEESRRYGLHAMDGLHVAAAKSLGAQEIVTTEKLTKPLYRVKSPRVIHLDDV